MENQAKVQVVDAVCMFVALENEFDGLMTRGGVAFYKGSEELGAHDNDVADRIEFWMYRDAMDGNGYRVGEERFTGVLKLYSKSDFQMNWGSPYVVSPWFIIPHMMDVAEIVPAEEPHEYTRDEAINFLDNCKFEDDPEELSDEEVLQEAFDHGMGDGDYFQSDDDFAYHELEYVFNRALERLPVPTFKADEKGRDWIVGDYDFNLDEYIERSKDVRDEISRNQ